MSMGLNMADGLQGMLKDGHKHFEGLDEAVAKKHRSSECSVGHHSHVFGPHWHEQAGHQPP